MFNSVSIPLHVQDQIFYSLSYPIYFKPNLLTDTAGLEPAIYPVLLVFVELNDGPLRPQRIASPLSYMPSFSNWAGGLRTPTSLEQQSSRLPICVPPINTKRKSPDHSELLRKTLYKEIYNKPRWVASFSLLFSLT